MFWIPWQHQNTIQKTSSLCFNLTTADIDNCLRLANALSTTRGPDETVPVLSNVLAPIQCPTRGHVFLYRRNRSLYNGECSLLVQVPAEHIVRLLLTACLNANVTIYDVVGNTTEMAAHMNCLQPEGKVRGPIMYSYTGKVKLTITLLADSALPQILGLSLAAFHVSRWIQLKVVTLSPLAGYILTPNWDGLTHYPPNMKSCVTLTPPPNHVTFVSFLSLALTMGVDIKKDSLDLVQVPCHEVENQVVLMKIEGMKGERNQPFLYPDDLSSRLPRGANIHQLPLHLYFHSHGSRQSTGFKIRYTFYPEKQKPQRVSTIYKGNSWPQGISTWNCSQAVWPDLQQHFTCDLVPQCAGGEDEAVCPYTTPRCGPGKLDVGGRCYVYVDVDYQSWTKADRACRQMGAMLASLETPDEWLNVDWLLQQADAITMYIGLRSTAFQPLNKYLLSLYIETLRWETGAVAYYIPRLQAKPKRLSCGALNNYKYVKNHAFRRNEIDGNACNIMTCETSSDSIAAFLCEMPSDMGHISTNHPSVLHSKFLPAWVSSLDHSAVWSPWGTPSEMPGFGTDEFAESLESSTPAPNGINHSGRILDHLGQERFRFHNDSEVRLPASAWDVIIYDYFLSVNVSLVPFSIDSYIKSIWNKTAIKLMACLKGHMTLEVLSCDPASDCWGKVRISNPAWMTSWSVVCDVVKPHPPLFECDSGAGAFVAYSFVCDFIDHCPDGSDESFCVHPPCPEDTWRCFNGKCLENSQRCNDIDECSNGEDESDCYKCSTQHPAETMPQPPLLLNANRPRFNASTITSQPRLCRQGQPCTSSCPVTHFWCADFNYCLPIFLRCNGVTDCPGLEDEVGCEQHECRGLYRCRHGADMRHPVCLHPQHLCDGVPQCPGQEDEVLCGLTCPAPCSCHGHAFFCSLSFPYRDFPALRFLETSDPDVSLGDFMNNSMLVHLGVSGCGFRQLPVITLPNLRHLDLSDNALTHFSCWSLGQASNLRVLNLAHNPVDCLFGCGLGDLAAPGSNKALVAHGGDASYAVTANLLTKTFSNKSSNDFSESRFKQHCRLMSVKFLNLSHVPARGVRLQQLIQALPALRALDVSHTGLTSLHGLDKASGLQYLDLRGCPMEDLSPQVIQGLVQLRLLQADHFKLCCPDLLPPDFSGQCLAPHDDVSSCEALLRSDVYRSVLAAFSVLALTGNVGSLVYRLVLQPARRSRLAFAVFVTHLALADLLMGLYLAIVGVADLLYKGSYAWNEAGWRASGPCTLAGCLALVSWEVSALIIVLITLDRLLVIRFPFSRRRFSHRGAQLVCSLTWLSSLALAAVPLLPVTSHWRFYQQSGLCVPLPVSQAAEFAGHRYAFSVLIVLNLVLFVSTAIGQALIYRSIHQNAMPLVHQVSRKQPTVCRERNGVIFASNQQQQMTNNSADKVPTTCTKGTTKTNSATTSDTARTHDKNSSENVSTVKRQNLRSSSRSLTPRKQRHINGSVSQLASGSADAMEISLAAHSKPAAAVTPISSWWSSTSSARQKDWVIARRLLTIALTNFLCWFPVGLCGVLSELGVHVPSEVNVALAVVVLPLNAAINPFLYTLKTLRDRQHRAQEARIRKILMAQLARP